MQVRLKGRVVGGKYRHRSIEVLADSTTRSTKDRVKEAVFSSLNNELENKVVLDLFAGSGALGIEALSRGATMAYFCDNNAKSIQIIENNIVFVEEKHEIYVGDYKILLSKMEKECVDIVLIDPPYSFNLDEILDCLFASKILKHDYILVFESDKPFVPTLNNATIKYYKYGLTHVTIIRGKL